MLWQEDATKSQPVLADDIVDITFRIQCRCLPVEHAYALSKAVRTALPWLDEEEAAGIHTIHVAESGNGWMRPADTVGELLYLSRRTRLALRLPRTRLKQAQALTGTALDIEGFPLTVQHGALRPLSTQGTLFSRYVTGKEDETEEAFVESIAEELERLGIRVRKLLCGKPHTISTPQGGIFTRSVMVADLSTEESVQLQRVGTGPHRKLGCGLFIPHKGIAPVKSGE